MTSYVTARDMTVDHGASHTTIPAGIPVTVDGNIAMVSTEIGAGRGYTVALDLEGSLASGAIRRAE